jgi:hypothetical protein
MAEEAHYSPKELAEKMQKISKNKRGFTKPLSKEKAQEIVIETAKAIGFFREKGSSDVKYAPTASKWEKSKIIWAHSERPKFEIAWEFNDDYRNEVNYYLEIYMFEAGTRKITMFDHVILDYEPDPKKRQALILWHALLGNYKGRFYCREIGGYPVGYQDYTDTPSKKAADAFGNTASIGSIAIMEIGHYVLCIDDEEDVSGVRGNSLEHMEAFYDIFKKYFPDKAEEETGEAVCSMRQVAVDGKCRDVSEFCGNDSKINYDPATGKCFCPSGYELTTSTEGNICQEAGDINLDISVVPNYPTPPLSADGKTQTRFAVQAISKKDKKPVELRFDVHYSTAPTKGVITSMQLRPGLYFVDYQTANLEGVKDKLEDYLYIYYVEDGKETYKTYPISLFSAKKSKVLIEREFFGPVEVNITFNGPKTKVLIYTLYNKEKYGVANAVIKYEDGRQVKTDKNGYVILETKEKFLGTEELYQEVELSLNRKYTDLRDKGLQHYGSVPVKNRVIEVFLQDFPKNLARSDNEQDSAQLASGMIAASNIMFYLAKGNELNRDISANASTCLVAVIKNIMEMTKAVEWFVGKCKAVIQSLIKYFRGQELKDIDISFDGLKKAAPKEWIEKLEKLDSLLGELRNNFCLFAWEKVEAAILYVYPDFSPDLLDIIYDEVVVKYIKEKIGIEDYAKGKIDQKIEDIAQYDEKVKKIEEVASGTIHNAIIKAFTYFYRKKNEFIMEELAKHIQNKDFSLTWIKNDILIDQSRQDFVNFTDKYLGQHELEYKFTMTDVYRKLLVEDAAKAVKAGTAVLAPEFFPVVSKGCEKVKDYSEKLKKQVLDNAQLLAWLKAYYDSIMILEKAVNNIIPLNISQLPPQGLELVEFAYAQERANDELHKLSATGLAVDSPRRRKVLDYIENKNDLKLDKTLFSIVEVVNELNPSDKEAKQFQDKLSTEIKTLKESNKQIEGQLENILKPKKKAGLPLKVLSWFIIIPLVCGIIVFLTRVFKR